MQELEAKKVNAAANLPPQDEDYDALQDLVGGEEENQIAIINKVKADHVFDIPEEEAEYDYGESEDAEDVDKKE